MHGQADVLNKSWRRGTDGSLDLGSEKSWSSKAARERGGHLPNPKPTHSPYALREDWGNSVNTICRKCLFSYQKARGNNYHITPKKKVHRGLGFDLGLAKFPPKAQANSKPGAQSAVLYKTWKMHFSATQVLRHVWPKVERDCSRTVFSNG